MDEEQAEGRRAAARGARRRVSGLLTPFERETARIVLRGLARDAEYRALIAERYADLV